jgi:predicted cobalt transporter CbtA
VLNRPQASLIERRLRWAGFLIAVGLVIQLTTFIWVHPLAFIAFVVIGCPLVGAGILLYLYSLVPRQASRVSPE